MTMDLRRCRFVQYQPGPVNLCAASPDGTRVAVYRPGSGLELWQQGGLVEAGWRCEGRMGPSGSLGRSVEAVAWVASVEENGADRLFTVGLDGLIVEWDLDRWIPKNYVDTNGGGAAWCLTVSPDQSHLAVGCENGTVRLFSLSRTSLAWVKNFDAQQGGRILSLAWSPCGTLLAAGTTKSLLSVYDVASGRIKHSLGMERASVRDGGQGRIQVEAIAWSLGFTRDGALWSADSLGNLCEWDMATGTQASCHRLSQADLFALASTGDSIFVAGADQKIYQMARSTDGRWNVAGKTRLHQHDVRCLTVLGKQGILISGSVDTSLGAYSIGDISGKQIKIQSYPTSPVAKLTSNSVMWTVEGAVLRCWDMSGPIQEAPRQLLQVTQSHHISAWDVSEDGRWIALLPTGSACPKLYAMTMVRDEAGRVTDVNLEDSKVSLAGQVQTLAFNGNFLMLSTVAPKKNATLLSVPMETLQVTQSTEMSIQAVKAMAFDGKNSVILGYTTTLINGKSVDIQQINSVSLSKGEAILSSHKTVQIYSLERERFEELPKRLAQELSSFPRILSAHRTPSGKLIVTSPSAILTSSSISPAPAVAATKRKTRNSAKAAEPQLDDRADQIKVLRAVENGLFFGLVTEQQAVLVERPWADLAAALPPAIKKKLFGGRS